MLAQPLNADFRDLLAALLARGVRFLVVGAHALAVHGFPRATGDLDVWLARDRANAERAWHALADFGAPVDTIGLTIEDLARPDQVAQIGQPPRRIDLLTSIAGVEFDAAWDERVVVDIEGMAVPFLGRDHFVRNKRAAGRERDIADAVAVERGRGGR